MARKKKYTAEQTRQFEQRYKAQPFKQCMTDIKYEYVDITFYMLDHKNFRELSVYSTKLYLYMRQWAYRSEMWKEKQVFPFSRSMAHNIGIMSESQAKRSLKELHEKGFIDKAGFDYNRTALWKFSDRWYKGGRQTF